MIKAPFLLCFCMLYISAFSQKTKLIKDGIDNKTLSASFPDQTEVKFASIEIENVVRKIVNKTKGTIYYADVKNIDSINLGKKNIDNIAGLEYLTKLSNLNLSINKISNLSALEKLVGLKTLGLTGNLINDKINVGYLRKLKNLKFLYIDNMSIGDSSHLLSELVNLEEFSANECNISNIDFTKKMVNLKKIYIKKNLITDISPVVNFKKLEVLTIQRNPIDSISAVSKLVKLETLDASYTNIMDINSILSNKGLLSVDISNTKVTKIVQLIALRSLSNLFIYNLQLPEGEVKYFNFQRPTVYIFK